MARDEGAGAGSVLLAFILGAVSGDLATTANLADVVSGVPTSGLNAKTNGASAASGCTPGADSRCKIQVPSPTPPRKRRSTSADSGTLVAESIVRSIRR